MNLRLALIILLALPAFGETTVSVTQGTFTPPKPPKPMDRKGASNAAAAMAHGAGVMAQVQCYDLQNKSKKAEEEGDSDKAMLYAMMAQQQCQQAGELMKAAAENKESQKSVSMSDVPDQAKYEAGNVQLDGDSGGPAKLLAFDDLAPSTSTFEIPSDAFDVPAVQLPETSERAATTSASDSVQPDLQESKLIGEFAAPRSPLDLIQTSAAEGDAPALQNGSNGTTAPIASLDNSSLAVPLSQEADNESVGDSGAPSSHGRGAIGTVSSESGGGSGGGDSASAPRKSAAFNSLLSQLNGNQANLGTGFPTGGQDVLALKKAKDKETSRVNIFEYASYRYYLHSTVNGNVRKQPLSDAQQLPEKAKPAKDNVSQFNPKDFGRLATN